MFSVRRSPPTIVRAEKVVLQITQYRLSLGHMPEIATSRILHPPNQATAVSFSDETCKPSRHTYTQKVCKYPNSKRFQKVHTYIHTCIHANKHTYIHTYRQTYLRTYIHTYMYACIHTHMPNACVLTVHAQCTHSARHSARRSARAENVVNSTSSAEIA